MTAQKGICYECGEPLVSPGAIGYHPSCAEKAHGRQRKEVSEKYPYSVVDVYGEELKRFESEHEAQNYLWRIRHAEIKKDHEQIS